MQPVAISPAPAPPRAAEPEAPPDDKPKEERSRTFGSVLAGLRALLSQDNKPVDADAPSAEQPEEETKASLDPSELAAVVTIPGTQIPIEKQLPSQGAGRPTGRGTEVAVGLIPSNPSSNGGQAQVAPETTPPSGAAIPLSETTLDVLPDGNAVTTVGETTVDETTAAMPEESHTPAQRATSLQDGEASHPLMHDASRLNEAAPSPLPVDTSGQQTGEQSQNDHADPRGKEGKDEAGSTVLRSGLDVETPDVSDLASPLDLRTAMTDVQDTSPDSALQPELIDQASTRERAEGPGAPRPERLDSGPRPAMMAAWVRNALNRNVHAISLQNGWQVMEMNLDGSQGTLTVKAKRDDDRMSVAVGLSDPKVGAMVQANAARIEQVLQAQYETAVDLSFFSGNTDQHERQQQGAQPGGTTFAEGAPTPSEVVRSATPRARTTDGVREWVG